MVTDLERIGVRNMEEELAGMGETKLKRVDGTVRSFLGMVISRMDEKSADGLYSFPDQFGYREGLFFCGRNSFVVDEFPSPPTQFGYYFVRMCRDLAEIDLDFDVLKEGISQGEFEFPYEGVSVKLYTQFDTSSREGPRLVLSKERLDENLLRGLKEYLS